MKKMKTFKQKNVLSCLIKLKYYKIKSHLPIGQKFSLRGGSYTLSAFFYDFPLHKTTNNCFSFLTETCYKYSTLMAKPVMYNRVIELSRQRTHPLDRTILVKNLKINCNLYCTVVRCFDENTSFA